MIAGDGSPELTTTRERTFGEILHDAGVKWLAEIEDINEDAPTTPEMLRLAAAWLDFYDETWEIIRRASGMNHFAEFPRDELQRGLRTLAASHPVLVREDTKP